MTTATQTAIRAFGRCDATGCRHAHVTALPAPTGKPLVPGTTFRAYHTGARDVAAAMSAAGLVCPNHGATMIYTPVKATCNPEKACDGRCTNAKRASCDCSCGGENHGTGFGHSF